ncbi:MAG: peptidoglycan-binding domain-containing protein [Bacteroidota bacterium]
MKIQNSAYPVYRAPKVAAAPITDGESQPQAQPQPQNNVQSQSVLSGVADFCKKVWNGIVDFFKGIFGKKPNDTLTQDEQAIAKTYKLLPTKENVQAFLNEAKGYETDGTLGPGTTNTEGTKTLQQGLKDLGYAYVSVTGEYDERTMEAVAAFKKDHGLHQSYKTADGQWAMNEFATQEMLQKLMSRLDRN